jgi:transcriptional antiterminator RfaH
MGWNVLHVRPRCEKKMAEYSEILGLSFYLPLRSETKIYQRRKVTVEKPVFPGYFFVSLDDAGRLSLLKTNNIVRILETGNERQLLHELAQVRKALAVDPTLGTCAALKRGKRVLIRGGPFMGVEGVVSDVKGNTKVRLNVDMIGQAVAVEVGREYLELID